MSMVSNFEIEKKIYYINDINDLIVNYVLTVTNNKI
jgi:hypothetical protein